MPASADTARALVCALTLVASCLVSLPLAAEPTATPDPAEASVDAPPVEHGGAHIDLWFSDTADINVGLQLGGDGAYILATGGVVLSQGADPTWQVGGGLGTRVGIERFFIELDVTGSALLEHDGEVRPAVLGRGRLGVGWRFASHFAVFGGAALNALVQFELPESIAAPSESAASSQSDEDAADTASRTAAGYEPLASSAPDAPIPWEIWPGFYVGFEF